MCRYVGFLAAMLALAGLLGCGSQSTLPEQGASSLPAPTPCIGKTITIGEISENPNEVILDVQPFAGYLAKRLAGFGYQCGQVKVADSVPQMIGWMKNGDVDIYWDSVFPATLVSDATGAVPILRRLRNCDPEYYSVIFTSKTSGIKSLDDLPGHMFGMDVPDSTSGLVMPAVYLMDHGLHLAVKESYSDRVAADEVGIYFTHGDSNTRQAVLSGNVSAGATDDYQYGTWEQGQPGMLILLAQTQPEPRQAVLVRQGLEEALRSAIKDELLGASADPQGSQALESAAKTCGFDDPPGGIAAAFELMRSMHEQLKLIPGWEAALQKGQW